MIPVGGVESEWPLRDFHLKRAELMAQAYRLSNATFRSEALDFARHMMRRAGDQLKRIAEDLSRQEYRFVNPRGPVHAPEVGLEDCCTELSYLCVNLPIALEAWLAEVGGVDLTGSHPARSKPEGLADPSPGLPRHVATPGDEPQTELNPVGNA